MATDQSRPVAFPLQPLNEIPDVIHQVLFVFLSADPVHAASSVFADVAPAIPKKRLVDQPVEVKEPEVFLLASLLCYRQ